MKIANENATNKTEAKELYHIEQENPVLSFASVLTGLIFIAAFVAVFYNEILALYIVISSIFVCAVFYSISAIIARQNKIIKLIQETNKILRE